MPVLVLVLVLDIAGLDLGPLFSVSGCLVLILILVSGYLVLVLVSDGLVLTTTLLRIMCQFFWHNVYFGAITSGEVPHPKLS